MPSERVFNLRNLVPELRPEGKDRFIMAILNELEKCEESLGECPLQLSLEEVSVLIGLLKAHQVRIMDSPETLAGEWDFYARLSEKLLKALG